MKNPFFNFKEEKINMERRKFLKWMGMAGLGLSPLVLASPVKELCGGRGWASASKTRPLMGTFVTVVVLDPSADRATEAMERAFAEMERLIPLFSRHEPESPVSYLNRQGYLKDIPFELQQIFQKVKIVHQATRGCFDITVKPILDLFEDRFSNLKRPPSEEEIRKTLKKVGFWYLAYNKDEIRFTQEGMGITLDGIAKGYIVEKAIDNLKAWGIRHVLINAGGDIQVLGGKENSRPWKIALQDPRDRNKIGEVIPLTDGAIATSGDYENYFDQDKKYHHIVDPETGFSPQHLASVSVLSPSLTIADALATALFVAPYPETLKFLSSFRMASAILIDRQGNRKKIKEFV